MEKEKENGNRQIGERKGDVDVSNGRKERKMKKK